MSVCEHGFDSSHPHRPGTKCMYCKTSPSPAAVATVAAHDVLRGEVSRRLRAKAEEYTNIAAARQSVLDSIAAMPPEKQAGARALVEDTWATAELSEVEREVAARCQTRPSKILEAKQRRALAAAEEKQASATVIADVAKAMGITPEQITTALAARKALIYGGGK